MPRNTEPLSLKLKALRKARDLSQADVGELLGVSGRVISNVEIGRRQLSHAEIDKIEKEYEVRLADIDTSAVKREEVSSGRLRIYTESQFFDFQETFLNERAEREYTLWFLNPESLPMLESEKVRSTWIHNISGGTRYHTIWILDVIDRVSFGHFIEHATNALTSAAALSTRKDLADSVHVHLVQLNAKPSTEVSDFATAYDKLLRESERSDSEEPNVRLHKPVMHDQLSPSAREFITRFYFHSASVVAYEPQPDSLRDRQLLALELKDVSDFASSESGRGYVILGRATTREFLRGLEAFRKSAGQEEGEGTKPKRGKNESS